MSLFEKHHTMTPDQHVAAANARFRLRMHMYNVRLRYERSVEMRTALENLATGAYTPHQYRPDLFHTGDWFPETYSPDDWHMATAGAPHRVVFTFAPLPPAAGGAK